MSNFAVLMSGAISGSRHKQFDRLGIRSGENEEAPALGSRAPPGLQNVPFDGRRNKSIKYPSRKYVLLLGRRIASQVRQISMLKSRAIEMLEKKRGEILHAIPEYEKRLPKFKPIWRTRTPPLRYLLLTTTARPRSPSLLGPGEWLRLSNAALRSRARLLDLRIAVLRTGN